MPAQDSRSAAKVAAVFAVPVALLTGVAVFILLSDAWSPETPAPVPSAPVSMPAPELAEWPEIVCRALLAQVPETIGDAAQRPVTEGPEQNAAYGEPPITLSCGVPEPEYEPTDEALTVSGVCWHTEPADGEMVWTTLDREVPVRVTVPDAYEGQIVVEFSEAILAAVRTAEEVPFGCT